MNIKFINVYTSNYQEEAERCRQNWEAYCRLSNQYTFLQEEIEIEDPFLGKLEYILRKLVLSDDDYVVWVDTDAYVYTPHDFYSRCISPYTEYDMIFSREGFSFSLPGCVNTGVMIFKVNDTSIEFMKDCVSSYKKDKINLKFATDQECINHLLGGEKYFNSHVITHAKLFNSQFTIAAGGLNFIDGSVDLLDDFIIHMAGIPYLLRWHLYNSIFHSAPDLLVDYADTKIPLGNYFITIPLGRREGLIGHSGLLGLFNDIKTHLPRPLTGIEVGSFQGESTKLFFNHLDIKRLYSIDPYTDNYDTTDGTSFQDMKKVKHNFRYRLAKEIKEKRLITLEMSADKAYHAFKTQRLDKDIDFIYIDGCHKYFHFVNDLKTFSNLVRPGGLICGHDYNHKDIQIGLERYFGRPPEKIYDDQSWFYVKK